MRMSRGIAGILPALLLLMGTIIIVPTAAQEVLLPAQSIAKAKELIQQTIEALGGQAYLNVKDVHCDGRYAQFTTQGELGGYIKIFDYVLLPDKNRTEFSDKHNIIDVNNGHDAWSLDKGGVTDLPPGAGDSYLEGLKRSIDHLFRFRLKEEGMIFRYGGSDVVDLKPVDWVEVQDSDRRITRIAIEKATHLPLRALYITRDAETRQRNEETEYFSNYFAVNGVQTPKQIARDRNGRKVYQVFWGDCQYNTGLTPSFFTREALEQQFAKVGKKDKKKS